MKIVPGTTSATQIEMTVCGVAAYLDTWALSNMATGDAVRRQRFVEALCGSGDLMFSSANAVEIAGMPLGVATKVRTFLDELGPHWVLVELDPGAIMRRELAGERSAAVLHKEMARAFCAARRSEVGPSSGILSVPDSFFELGRFIEWVRPHSQALRRTARSADDQLFRSIAKSRALCDSNPRLLDLAFPPVPFSDQMPATFALKNLLRNLLIEARAFRLKAGDFMDFCHAAVGASYGSFVALDKHWKRRVETLPRPHGLARIYGPNELDRLVAEFEVSLTC